MMRDAGNRAASGAKSYPISIIIRINPSGDYLLAGQMVDRRQILERQGVPLRSPGSPRLIGAPWDRRPVASVTLKEFTFASLMPGCNAFSVNECESSLTQGGVPAAGTPPWALEWNCFAVEASGW